MTNEEEAEIPTTTQFTHSVKISQTAKGARIDVHVFANGKIAAISEAIDMYKTTRSLLENEGETVAPFEVKANG